MASFSNNSPSKEEIFKVHEKIKPFIHKTPILTSETFNKVFGGSAFFKCENFQKIGAFKMRGAVNAILSLSEKDKQLGVATHSSGNHAQAVALSAKFFGIKAKIVMPKNAPVSKVEAVKGYGGDIVFCEPTIKAREETLKSIIEESNAIEIHPFNNYKIIEGQATVAKELLEELPKLDYIVAPVGGGGLLSGTVLSAQYFGAGTKVIGAEPLNVDDAYWSLKNGRLMPSVNKETIADGLRTGLGSKTFPIIKEFVEEIVRVDENEIITAMRFLWERMKIVVEPSGAVSVAAVLKKDFKNLNVGVVLSGGNVDLSKLPF